MEEKIKDVLDAYTFQTTRVCRGRGAFICDTDQGMKIVKAYHRSPQRLEFEQLVKYTDPRQRVLLRGSAAAE